MKRVSLIVSVLLATVTALAQGTVNFNNHEPFSGIDAPVSLNWTSETGFGTFPLGSRYLAQLCAGSTADSLSPVGVAVFFRNSIATGQGTGYFAGGQVDIPFLSPQAGGYFQVRFWDGAAGSTYEGALAANGLTGFSNVIHLTTLGDPHAAPPSIPVDLVGLMPSGFILIPEPSPLALGLLGIAALVLLRRN
jgi:hypothetical protein